MALYSKANRESRKSISSSCLKRFRNAFITIPQRPPLHSQTFRNACITNLRNPPLRSLSPRRSRSQTRRPVELTSGVDKNKRGSREKTPILPLEFYSGRFLSSRFLLPGSSPPLLLLTPKS